MNHFPTFACTEENQVAKSPDETVKGFLFKGQDESQIVFWECEDGGTVEEHSHDFWEWAIVVEGEFHGLVDGKEIHLKVGDECIIPPGVVHSGSFSKNYRAIDAFGKERVSWGKLLS